MKLIVCIVSDQDAPSLLEELMDKGYRATKLASTGGFLKEGNTTLLMGVTEEQMDNVIEITKNICKVRQQVITPISPLPGPTESFGPLPLEVSAGGATIFVLNVEKHLKV